MSETVNIHLKNSNEIINIIELDRKVWMTKWFISDAPDVAREIGKALINAAIEMEESK